MCRRLPLAAHTDAAHVSPMPMHSLTSLLTNKYTLQNSCITYHHAFREFGAFTSAHRSVRTSSRVGACLAVSQVHRPLRMTNATGHLPFVICQTKSRPTSCQSSSTTAPGAARQSSVLRQSAEMNAETLCYYFNAASLTSLQRARLCVNASVAHRAA